MLVLTRFIDESVVIGDSVRVTVVAVFPDGKVRLGFEAPASVPIHREEVYQRQMAESGVVRPGGRGAWDGPGPRAGAAVPRGPMPLRGAGDAGRGMDRGATDRGPFGYPEMGGKGDRR